MKRNLVLQFVVGSGIFGPKLTGLYMFYSSQSSLFSDYVNVLLCSCSRLIETFKVNSNPLQTQQNWQPGWPLW